MHHLIQVVLEIFDRNGLIRDEIKELSQCHHSTYALLEEEVGDVFTVLTCPQAGGGRWWKHVSETKSSSSGVWTACSSKQPQERQDREHSRKKSNDAG